MVTKLLIVLLVVSLLFSGWLYWSTNNTVMRWQERGIRNHQEQNLTTPMQPWLTSNPYVIAAKVWIELCSNITALFISLVSGIHLVRRKNGKNRLQMSCL